MLSSVSPCMLTWTWCSRRAHQSCGKAAGQNVHMHLTGMHRLLLSLAVADDVADVGRDVVSGVVGGGRTL